MVLACGAQTDLASEATKMSLSLTAIRIDARTRDRELPISSLGLSAVETNTRLAVISLG